MTGSADVTDRGTRARVEGLFVHPLKSAGAIAVDVLELDERGAAGDRRWLLVDTDGVGITARKHHRLAQIRPSFAEVDRNGGLRLDAPGFSSCDVRVPTNPSTRSVQIWLDDVPAHDAGDMVAEWCSDAIGAWCRMVYLAENARRPLQAKYAGSLPYADRQVAFSDGAPLLLLGSASIEALNVRLHEQGSDVVTHRRFRPNVLLAETTAHEEDTWREVVIGGVTIGVGSKCPRCVMTTIDPDTAEGGVEPLRTLAQYRRDETGVVFGMNATHAAPGSIRLDDRVTVTALH